MSAQGGGWGWGRTGAARNISILFANIIFLKSGTLGENPEAESAPSQRVGDTEAEIFISLLLLLSRVMQHVM